MEALTTFLNWSAEQFQFFSDFLVGIPQMMMDLFSYVQLFFLKLTIMAQIEFMKLSYNSARILLQEIGFNDALKTAFNMLPSEIRFYAFKFGVPQGLSILANFFTTGFVMRMTR
ncbi:DUF2523 domain-containing protein [Vibrio sp. T187]|uniref:DUF2523 family protein n=1 Tax=Vibrio TaxID=662 RepID=UPI0010C9B567|nr:MULTISPECIES: DUF2523 family protein [Vibrio]MBW3697029.1 DUF2523 domain-containing protein [Vibrio sp. T187]